MRFLVLLLFLCLWPHTIQGQGFTLFEHMNYGGRSVSPPAGLECINLGDFNDLTTSIKFDWGSVPTATKLSFFNDGNCMGAEWSTSPGNTDIALFNGDWNDKWSSFRWELGLVAFALFEHSNYGGRYFSPRSIINNACENLRNFNDLTTSIKFDWERIPPDTRLSFFNDGNCNGAEWVASRGQADIYLFSPEWNDKWSSFRWTIGPGRLMAFALFENENYSGRYYSPPYPLDGRCVNLGDFNDLASSMKFDWGSVPTATKLSFFNDGDCKGAEWSTPPGKPDIAQFSGEWNNQWSSFRLESWPKFLVTAHMVNTISAVNWALANGANAVEMDLRFDNNKPLEFRHGGIVICDCICTTGGVCGVLERVQCEAKTNFAEMINHLATKSMALVYIDTKVDSITDQVQAGANLFSEIKMIYDRGWNGRILLNGDNPKYLDYLKSFAESAAQTGLKDKIYYTFDASDEAPSQLLSRLQTITTNAVYSWGISACGSEPGSLKSNVRDAKTRDFKLVGVWTYDKVKSLKEQIDNGAGAILTNYPARLYSVAADKGLLYPQNRLGLWDTSPPPCERAEADCDYSPGGCRISLPALPGCLTKCTYKGAWTCGGQPVQCKASDSPWCFSSTGRSSREACQAGKGDCGGY